MGMLRRIAVRYSDGSIGRTMCAGDRTDDQVRDYYLGKWFDNGWDEPLVQALAVDFEGFARTCPHCGHPQFQPPRPDGRCELTCCARPLS